LLEVVVHEPKMLDNLVKEKPAGYGEEAEEKVVSKNPTNKNNAIFSLDLHDTSK